MDLARGLQDDGALGDFDGQPVDRGVNGIAHSGFFSIPGGQALVVATGSSRSVNSCSKWRMADSVGLGAVWPRAHSDAFCIALATLRIVLMSSAVPFPPTILFSRCSIWVPPIRQGAHLPQDSSTQKSR